MKNKIKKLKELKKIVILLKKQNKKIIFTNGCFDILHIGHIRYLKEAKKLGDVLIVGLNSDTSVRRLKGKNRPFIPENERAEILASLEMVDYIIIFPELTPKNLIKHLRPDYQVKGGDYRRKQIKEKKVVESYGGKVVVVRGYKGYSTTELIKKIKNSP